MPGQLIVKTFSAIVLMLLALSCAPTAGQDISQPPAAGPADAPPTTAVPDIALSGVDAQLLTPFKSLRETIRTAPGSAEPAVQLGVVDWGRKVLVAQGRCEQQGQGPQAEAMARRGASLLALRNAVALAGGVRIGPNGRVANVRNGVIRIQAFVKGFEAKEFHAELVNGRMWQVAEARLPLYGIKSLAIEVHDAQVAARSAVIRTIRRVKWVESSAAETVAGDVVVIDARGTGFAPSLFPLVTNSDGEVLMDMQTVGKEVAAQEGMCAYATTDLGFDKLQSMLRTRGVQALRGLASAGLSEGNVDGVSLDKVLLAQAAQAASQPQTAPARRQPRRLPVKAAKAGGDEKTRLILDSPEADKLRNDGGAAALVKGGKVLIIVDAAAAGQEGRLPDLDQALHEILAAR